MTLSKSAYDKGQWFIRIFIPAFITFYVGVDQFVNLPKEAEVAGVAGLLAIFLGALLQSSSNTFKRENEANGGTFQIKGIDENGMPHLGMDVAADPAELMGKKTITMVIDKPPVYETPSSVPVDQPTAQVDERPPWEQGPPQV